MDQFGSRTSDEDYAGLLKQHEEAAAGLLQDVLRRHLGERLRSRRSAAASISSAPSTSCSAPTARSTPQGGPLFIRETIKALDGMKLKPEDRRRIYFGNALQMLKMK